MFGNGYGMVGETILRLVAEPLGPKSSSYRVVRGGGWFYNAKERSGVAPQQVRPLRRNFSLGFRISRTQRSLEPFVEKKGDS